MELDIQDEVSHSSMYNTKENTMCTSTSKVVPGKTIQITHITVLFVEKHLKPTVTSSAIIELTQERNHTIAFIAVKHLPEKTALSYT